MPHLKICSTILDFEGDLKSIVGLPCREFEEDGWNLSIEDFKKKWGIVELQCLGKYHCKAGYTDRLHPEKSWTGKNPEIVAKLKKYMEEIENEIK